MNEVKDIKKARRKVFDNPFLREVSYMFSIEASPIFESKLSELESYVKTSGFKAKQIGSDGVYALIATKNRLDILITSRLLTVRVDIDEYKNYDEFKEFLIPFVVGCAKVLNVDQIDNLVILKTNNFALQRDNEVAKQLTIEQYCETLFSKSFLSSHAVKGDLKNARGIKVSAQYTTSANDEVLKVELLVGCLDSRAFRIEEIYEKLTNANDAIFDMWSYTMSKSMKDVLNLVFER